LNVKEMHWIFIYASQFYIAHGEYHAKHLSCGIGGMHDEYVFTCILFYYGMLKTWKGEYTWSATVCNFFIYNNMLNVISDFPELEWFWCSKNNIIYYRIRIYGFQYFYILLHRRDSHGTGNSSKLWWIRDIWVII